MSKPISKTKKILLVVLIPIIGITILSASIFGIAYGYLNRDTIKLDIDENETYQSNVLFGASSAWNFRVLGKDENAEIQQEIINALYGKDGLELSVFRYNIGAGSIDLNIPTYNECTSTESFFDTSKYVDNSSFADESNYDASKDAYYLDMFKLSLDTGDIKKVVLFSNSPHYLLTKNHLTHADVEHENNLPEENFGAFAKYVLISSKIIKDQMDSWGYTNIPIYISPVNEPQWKWGGSSNGQEGCHYDADHLAKFYDVFYTELKAFNADNNTSFIMDIYESGNYKLGLASSKNKKYFNEFSKYSYFEELDEISMHSYAADTDKSIRRKWYNYFKKYDKKFVMSEYCVMQGGVDTSIQMGINSSKVIMQDLNILNAVEWNWWLGFANGGWEDGLIYFNRETKEINKYYRYYMYGQFMKYAKGTRFKADIHDLYDFGGVDSVAFKDGDTLTFIILNDNNTPKNIKIELDGITSSKMIETYENTYWKESDLDYTGVYTVQPNSVSTIILKRG